MNDAPAKTSQDSESALMVNYDPESDEGYYAAVSNDANLFKFMGEGPLEQQRRVKRLGELMSEYDGDAEAILDELPILLDWPHGISSEQMFQTLFSDTETLGYLAEEIFAVPEEGQVLLDVLSDAGEALLAAL